MAMAKTLRRNDRGPEVKKIQEALRKLGYHLPANGHFGPNTETAVRKFQKSKCLLADGVVGSKTLKVLTSCAQTGTAKSTAISPNSARLMDLVTRIGPCMYQSALLAQSQILQSRSYPVSSLTISYRGLQFMYAHETGPKSKHLHWPEGASGVTLGPGYDMKMRSKSEIVKDLTAIGVDPSTAQKVSQASHLTGGQAKAFATNNTNLVILTTAQQMALLKNIVPHYENTLVKKYMQGNLLQHEYDALVSFAYNPGGYFDTVAKLINNKQVAKAMAEILTRVGGGPGLIPRRQHEVALYTTCIYWHSHGYSDGAHLPG